MDKHTFLILLGGNTVAWIIKKKIMVCNLLGKNIYAHIVGSVDSCKNLWMIFEQKRVKLL